MQTAWLTPAGIYLPKVNKRNTRTRYEICSKLAIKIPERHHWRRSGIYIMIFDHISHLVRVFPLLTLSRLMLAGTENLVVELLLWAVQIKGKQTNKQTKYQSTFNLDPRENFVF